MLCLFVRPLLCLQSDCIRKQWGTNNHSAPHMHLLVVTWFFWSHGFHGNRAIVLTGSDEGCISSILHYTHHTHTQVVMSDGMKLESCYREKVTDDWYASSHRDIPGVSSVLWKTGSVGWHFEKYLQLVYKRQFLQPTFNKNKCLKQRK